jgi:HAD superfamily hydrolase (TIGR01484 family)
MTEPSTSWSQPAAVASDCDETLTTHGMLLPSAVLARQMLGQKGIPFVVVTGRAAGFAWTVFELLQADAVVAENGGILVERSAPELLLEVSSGEAWAGSSSRGWPLGREIFKTLQSEGLVPTSTHPTMDVAFRVSDFTFPVAGLSKKELSTITRRVEELGAAFVFSTIHAHIMPQGQSKAAGLLFWAKRHGIDPSRILTIGDSPNDESLFDPQTFRWTWGVAGIRTYLEALQWRPRRISAHHGSQGFADMVCRISDQPNMLPRWIAQDEGWNVIVFVDGACPMCSSLGRWLLKNARLPQDWMLASLQGHTAARLLPESLRSNAANPDARPDALVVWLNGAALVGADGVLAILQNMGPWGSFLAKIGRIIPGFLRQRLYRMVARLRFLLPTSSPDEWSKVTAAALARCLP